ncbi:MAG: SDR family oxidoreductase [Erythrobacter sp.]
MSAPVYHKAAIVTGAAGSLGQVISAHLLEAGFHVCLTDIDTAPLDGFAAQFEANHAMIARLDVRDAYSWQSVIEQVKAQWGGIGVLVNNAALTKTTPIFEISADEFDAVTAIAMKGTFLGCQLVGQKMRDQGYGRIINMASLAGQNGGAATGAHYAAAKGGIMTLTKVFARELAANGVTVNAISPGPLDLESVRKLLPAEKLEAVTKSIPAGTLGDAQYVAQIVALLASPQAASAIGSTFDVNGGLYLR